MWIMKRFCNLPFKAMLKYIPYDSKKLQASKHDKIKK